MAMNAGWQGQERRSGGDRRMMVLDRPEQERRLAERRSDAGAGDDRVRYDADSWSSGRSGSATGVGVRSNAEKDPEDWTTGDEPMTGPQRSYLHTLAREAGEMVPDNLSKADASRLIDELRARSGRGANPSDGIG